VSFLIPGGKHGGPEFYDERRIALVAQFLEDVLSQTPNP
jgi:hypothetical protein